MKVETMTCSLHEQCDRYIAHTTTLASFVHTHGITNKTPARLPMLCRACIDDVRRCIDDVWSAAGVQGQRALIF
jgi:hypothetical protein